MFMIYTGYAYTWNTHYQPVEWCNNYHTWSFPFHAIFFSLLHVFKNSFAKNCIPQGPCHYAHFSDSAYHVVKHGPNAMCPPVTTGNTTSDTSLMTYLICGKAFINHHMTFFVDVINHPCPSLSHWGRVTHTCVSNLTIIDKDNGFSPGRRQAIIWTNAGILLIERFGTISSEIIIEIVTFSFKKMPLKVPSAKWRSFCLGPNVLTAV